MASENINNETPKTSIHPNSWSKADRRKNKKLRNAGLEYISRSGRTIAAKKQPDILCNCPQQCSSKIPKEIKERLFVHFYGLGDANSQNAYLQKYIEMRSVNKRLYTEERKKGGRLQRRVTCKYKVPLKLPLIEVPLRENDITTGSDNIINGDGHNSDETDDEDDKVDVDEDDKADVDEDDKVDGEESDDDKDDHDKDDPESRLANASELSLTNALDLSLIPTPKNLNISDLPSPIMLPKQEDKILSNGEQTEMDRILILGVKNETKPDIILREEKTEENNLTNAENKPGNEVKSMITDLDEEKPILKMNNGIAIKNAAELMAPAKEIKDTDNRTIFIKPDPETIPEEIKKLNNGKTDEALDLKKTQDSAQGDILEVCQKAFMNIYAITEKRVRLQREKLIDNLRSVAERRKAEQEEMQNTISVARELAAGCRPLLYFMDKSNQLNRMPSLPKQLLMAIDNDITLVNNFFRNQLWKPENINKKRKLDEV